MIRFLLGVAIGSIAMYMLDPVGGGRRRAIVRDKFIKFGNDVMFYGGKRARDIRNRTQGMIAETLH